VFASCFALGWAGLVAGERSLGLIPSSGLKEQVPGLALGFIPLINTCLTLLERLRVNLLQIFNVEVK
jgi:hypothetical protein